MLFRSDEIDTSPEPDRADAPSPIEQDWAEAYSAFSLSQGSGYRYALHDMNADGTPELLVWDDMEDVLAVTVYTFAGNSVKETGHLFVAFWESELYYYNNTRYPGLLHRWPGAGDESYTYYGFDGTWLDTNQITQVVYWEDEDYSDA